MLGDCFSGLSICRNYTAHYFSVVTQGKEHEALYRFPELICTAELLCAGVLTLPATPVAL